MRKRRVRTALETLNLGVDDPVAFSGAIRAVRPRGERRAGDWGVMPLGLWSKFIAIGEAVALRAEELLLERTCFVSVICRGEVEAPGRMGEDVLEDKLERVDLRLGLEADNDEWLDCLR